MSYYIFSFVVVKKTTLVYFLMNDYIDEQARGPMVMQTDTTHTWTGLASIQQPAVC